MQSKLKNFKRYYLPWYLVISVAFGLKIFLPSTKVSLLEAFLITQVAALTIAAIAGTLYYFQDTRWGPNKRRKLMSKSPFTDFHQLGFQHNEYELTGTLKDYEISIQYDWNANGGAGSIITLIYFNPRHNSQFISKNELKDLQKKYKQLKIIFARNHLFKEWPVTIFEKPKFKDILLNLNEQLSVLRQENLESVRLEELRNMTEEFTEYLKNEDKRR